MNKCLCCGEGIQNLPKKRAKQFCNSTCRSNYWQKKKRKDSEPKEPKLPPKKQVNNKPPAIATNSFQGLLNLAKSGATLAAVEEAMKGVKLTPPQISMIMSKIK